MNFFAIYAKWFYLFAILMIVVACYTLVLSAPRNFPSGEIIAISRGSSLSDIAAVLERGNIVRFPSILKAIVRVTDDGSNIKSGAYLFSAPQNVITVASRLVMGDFGIPPVRMTFHEGVTVRDIASDIADVYTMIQPDDFVSEAKRFEGYLFPDTYLFQSDATAKSIIESMRTNFDNQIRLLSEDIKTSGHSIRDIVTLASLVEKEARTEESKKLVAGILWNRLKLGMPLQVDAVFGYIFNRDTYSPSFEDLKVDSPYNTYLHIGIPPGPINNPGMESIQAVLYPTKTDYLYYLTGFDNLMHYATTYAEHQSNQRKYLK
jgi:UPF0755 protein